MSNSRKETVKVISQSMGVKCTDNALKEIAATAELRLKEVILDAKKFMRHSFRNSLSAEDINSALRLRNMESLFGYSSSDPLVFRKATSTVTSSSSPNAGEDVYYLQDKPIKLDEYLAQPLPHSARGAPQEPTFSVHWLAIEGVQPRIPQNPLPAIDPRELEISSRSTRHPDSTGKRRRLGSSAFVSQDGAAVSQASSSTSAPSSVESADVAGAATAEIAPLVKHLLSKEQQLYLENVCTVMKNTSSIAPTHSSSSSSSTTSASDGFSLGSDATPYAEDDSAVLQRAVLRSLAQDAGLQQLLPFFTQFIAEEVSSNLRNLNALHTMLRMAEALLQSPHLFVEHYLHQLIPVLMTCLVGKRLCQHAADDDHWALRKRAAQLIATVCHKYGHSYRTLQARIVKQLVTALCDPSKPLTTHYGAIIGLAALGPHIVRTVLIPCLPLYLAILAPQLEESANPLKHASSSAQLNSLMGDSSSVSKLQIQEASPSTRKSSSLSSSSSSKSTESMPAGLPDGWGAPVSSIMDYDSSSSSSSIPAPVFPSSIQFRPVSSSISASSASLSLPDVAAIQAAAVKQLEAQQCYTAMLKVFGEYVRVEIREKGFVAPQRILPPDYVHQASALPVSEMPDRNSILFSYFGEALQPYLESANQ